MPLDLTISSIYDNCNLSISNFTEEKEGKAYQACRFNLNELFVISRKSKITPKKIGQFVTCWTRNSEGITTPFSEDTSLDLLVINVQNGNQVGQFVFPRKVLLAKGILSVKNKEGKRGFRVYPPWDQPNNKQAIRTQNWQIQHFIEINENIDLERFKLLYCEVH